MATVWFVLEEKVPWLSHMYPRFICLRMGRLQNDESIAHIAELPMLYQLLSVEKRHLLRV
jgi:hypothetical protein